MSPTATGSKACWAAACGVEGRRHIVAASRTACFNLLYFHMHTQGLSAMIKAPQLQRAAELAKDHKRIGKYFAKTEYPQLKLVQTVIQSQLLLNSCAGAARKILLGAQMCMCTWPLYVLSVTRRLATRNRSHFSISESENCWLWLGAWPILTEHLNCWLDSCLSLSG